MKTRLTLIYIIGIILTAGLILVSCGEEKKEYRIGVSQCSNDDWRNKMNEEIEREILVHPEASVEIRAKLHTSVKMVSEGELRSRERGERTQGAEVVCSPIGGTTI